MTKTKIFLLICTFLCSMTFRVEAQNTPDYTAKAYATNGPQKGSLVVVGGGRLPKEITQNLSS